jgi:hypothetical protein
MPTVPHAWTRSLEQLVRFVSARGRLPSSSAQDEAERALAWWIARQRKRWTGSFAGHPLTADQVRLLDAALPGWQDPHMVRWSLNARAVAAYRAATGAWPSKRAADPETARLGRWLPDQRAAAADPERPGRWSAERRASLDRLLPGWDGTVPERGELRDDDGDDR